MKLFTVGPVQMFPRTLELSKEQLPYFRDEDFSNMMLHMEKQLNEFLSLKHGTSIFISGSGTSAMESLVACSFTPQDKVLVINGGSFGERFVQLCQMHQIPYDEYHITFPEVFDEETLATFDGTAYRAVLVNLHETSIGQLYPIEALSAFAKRNHAYLIVDAISTFLADPYDMDRYGIDVTILSSQKALACAPGISMIAMQQDFYETMVEPKEDHAMYLSIKEHVKNMKRGQTPNTPAVGVLLQISDRLEMIKEMGLEVCLQETAEKAAYFRSLVKELPISIPAFPHSNALTPILIEQDRAKEVYQKLKAVGYYVTPSGGSLAKKLLRVGHLGYVTTSDYDELVKHMKEILK